MISLSACASKTKPQGAAIFPAVIDTNQLQVIQNNVIYFTGDVRMNAILWREGITLAEGLLQAHYTGYNDPFSIIVTRNGVGYKIDVRALLRGEDNPALEPGDRINVRR